MASLKALFSVFSQTASLQFAQGGGRGDNFKTSVSHFSIVRPKLANGEFVCVRSFVRVLWRAKCKSIQGAQCKSIQGAQCASMQMCSCASTGVCFYVQLHFSASTF